MVLPNERHRFSAGWRPLPVATGVETVRLSLRGRSPARGDRLCGALERLYRHAGRGTRAGAVLTSAEEHAASSPEPATSASERRALPRRHSACSVHICVVPRDEPVNSHTLEWLMHAGRSCGPLVDVSLRSVSAAMSEPVAEDERVMLRLTNRRLGKEVDRCARVIRSIPAGGGEWKVVCRFDELLTLEELQHFARYPFESRCV